MIVFIPRRHHKYFILFIILLFTAANFLFAQERADSITITPAVHTIQHSPGFSTGNFITHFGFTPEEGLILGSSFRVRSGHQPNKSLTEISATHAFSTRAWRWRIYHEMNAVFGNNNDLITDIDIRIPNNTTYFYGYGMNSVYDKSQPEHLKYYRARYDLADVYIDLRHHFSPTVALTIGANYEYYEMDGSNKFNARRFISQTGMGPTKNGLTAKGIFNLQKYLGYVISLNVDTRNSRLFPEKGVQWKTTIRQLYQLKSSRYDPTMINSDLSFYLPLLPNRLTFANRIGIGTTLGRFSYQHAQYLGNNDDLRGYYKERWAGNTKVYNQAEVRWRAGSLQTRLTKGPWGLLFFTDAGLVWTPADTNHHPAIGYGGGLWFAPGSKLLITVNYAVSREESIPFLLMGWRF